MTTKKKDDVMFDDDDDDVLGGMGLGSPRRKRTPESRPASVIDDILGNKSLERPPTGEQRDLYAINTMSSSSQSMLIH